MWIKYDFLYMEDLFGGFGGALKLCPALSRGILGLNDVLLFFSWAACYF